MTPISKLTVWIVILNWNGLEDTVQCLYSLSCLETGFMVHILVLDNGSDLDPRPILEAQFPLVELERFKCNRGFAGGCNEGIKRAVTAGADYVLLLNNDTLADPHFLDPLVHYCLAHPRAAAVAPLICYVQVPERIWFAGATINLALGHFKHRQLNGLKSRSGQSPIQSHYVTGCCMLIPVTALQALGPLDARLFAYFEDVDFCLRARRAGFDTVCIPESTVWHKESASTRRNSSEGSTSALKHYLNIRNRTTVVIEHASLPKLACYLFIALPIRIGYFLAFFALCRQWVKMVWFMRGVVHGLQGHFENRVAQCSTE
ncbi:MAG: glycosyltransferase family 2 protein [Herpetosiphonaceae bacterium]|nr:glycosyltransferase family 2 protein [Herpetosiphonaceae bacterium]